MVAGGLKSSPRTSFLEQILRWLRMGPQVAMMDPTQTLVIEASFEDLLVRRVTFFGTAAHSKAQKSRILRPPPDVVHDD